MFGKRACALLREVAFVSGDNLPQYNDEAVRMVLEETKAHHDGMREVTTEVAALERERQGVEPGQQLTIDWELHTQAATTLVIHHSAILRNKRLLLLYTNERMKRIQEMRWQQRSLPEHIQSNLSPSERSYFEAYSRTLQRFMRKESGVGMDVTMMDMPPRDLQVKVRVVRELGEVILSVGPTHLAAGSVHSLPRREVERLLRSGDLEALDLIRE